jgi:uncharacterized RDD family membrane protein YckC
MSDEPEDIESPTGNAVPPTGEPGAEDDGGLAARLGRATSRFALRPARAVARQGRDALTDEAERAIEGLMAGPLPEAVGRALVEHRVVARVVAEGLDARAAEPEPALEGEPLDELAERILRNPALERLLTNLVDSRLTQELADRVVQSPAFKGALRTVLSSPEVRAALVEQTSSFGSDLATAARGRARRADDSLERIVHRRPATDGSSPSYGGLVTRGSAFVVDALLINLVFVVGGALIGLVASLFGELRPQWLVGLLASFAWAGLVALYFVGFWATIGQTPGMRLLRLRVVHGSGQELPVWRACVRLVGLVLAIIPMFAGFVPVLFDGERRALQDYLAGTAVVDEPEPGELPAQPAPGPAL